MQAQKKLSHVVNEDITKLLVQSSIASAALLALIGVNQADAAIIYQSYNQVIDSTNSGNPVFFDLDGDTLDDLIFIFGSDTSVDDGQTDAFSIVSAESGLVFSDDPDDGIVALLAQNTQIDGTNVTGNKGNTSGVGILAASKYDNGRVGIGDWYNGGNGVTDGFVGFAFSDAASDIFYAWARLDIAPYTDGNLDSLSITLKDVGYESTPNTPILAGAGIPATVPEGNTTAGLIVVGLGAAATRILLKRSRTPQRWEELAQGTSKTSKS